MTAPVETPTEPEISQEAARAMLAAFDLGRQDFAFGEPRGPGGDGAWGARVSGWDAAYRDSLEKASGGLRRIHAGRYESEDGWWSIVETGRARWALIFGQPGLRSQAEIMTYPTFADAMDGLRAELPDTLAEGRAS